MNTACTQPSRLRNNRRIVFPLLVMTLLLSSLINYAQPASQSPAQTNRMKMRRYSGNVGDSFSVFIQLPDDYSAEKAHQYPIVYLLDGNFYFDMMAPIVRKYAQVGMLPPLILVGMGYRNLAEMDSLRDRDFTFPKSTDTDMSISGGGGKFLAFLQQELMPEIEQKLLPDTTKRVLAGHSLGGYFTCYALMQHLSAGAALFSHYVAASPSLDYSHYWLPSKLKQISAQGLAPKSGLYITYGSVEDAEDADMSGHIKWAEIADSLGRVMQQLHFQYKAELFSNLRHMDTAIPSFIKGLQLALVTE